MSIYEPAAAPWPGRALAVFRVVAGYLFLLAGTMKLFNLPPMPDGAPPVALMSQMGTGAVLELVGGALIIVGLLTRPPRSSSAARWRWRTFSFTPRGAFFWCPTATAAFQR